MTGRCRGALLGCGVAAIVAFACAPAQAAGRCGSHPWCDTSLSAERRAALLLAASTR